MSFLTSTEGIYPRVRINVLNDGLSLAGFEVTFYGWFWVTPEGFRCPPTQLNNGRVGFLKFAHFEMQVFIKNRQASDSVQEIGLAAPKDALKFGATGNCSLGWATFRP